jgi:hypothetical protein
MVRWWRKAWIILQAPGRMASNPADWSTTPTVVAKTSNPVTLHSIVNQQGHQMTRKHFEMLAESIRCILNPDARLQAAVAVGQVAHKLNPRFDHQKFYVACGVIQPTV